MPSRGWRPSASTSAASSSSERPIVPPAPAEFSSRSQVVSEQRSSTCSSAGTQRSSPGLEARRRGASRRGRRRRPPRSRRPCRRSRRMVCDALVVDRVVRRREVAEVERVHEHRADARLGAPLAEAREVVRGVLGEAPRARALREELHRVGADLDRAVERLLDPACAVGPEEHAANLASRDERPRPHGAQPDRLPPHRRRAHVPLQLALRARPRRRVPAPDREHRHEPRGGGVGRADPGVARAGSGSTGTAR